jgi:hypothetical protein
VLEAKEVGETATIFALLLVDSVDSIDKNDNLMLTLERLVRCSTEIPPHHHHLP